MPTVIMDSTPKYSQPSKHFLVLAQIQIDLLRDRQERIDQILSDKAVKYRPRINKDFEEEKWRKFKHEACKISKQSPICKETPKEPSSPSKSRPRTLSLRKSKDGKYNTPKRKPFKDIMISSQNAAEKLLLEDSRFDHIKSDLNKKKKLPIKLSPDFDQVEPLMKKALKPPKFSFITSTSRKRAGRGFTASNLLNENNISQLSPSLIKGMTPKQKTDLNSKIMHLNAKRGQTPGYRMSSPIAIRNYIFANDSSGSKLTDAFYTDAVNHPTYLKLKNSLAELSQIAKGNF